MRIIVRVTRLGISPRTNIADIIRVILCQTTSPAEPPETSFTIVCPHKIDAAKLQSGASKMVSKELLKIFTIIITKNGTRINKYSDTRIKYEFV